jgi:isopentenyl phosphate kinase
MILLKLGGSLITYKRSMGNMPMRRNELSITYKTKEYMIRSVAKTLRSENIKKIIIVHGGGTHGHRTVLRWKKGLTGKSKKMMPWEVCLRMIELNERVVRILGEEDLPAISLSPSNFMESEGGRIGTFDCTSVNRLLDRECIPVLRGDVVPDLGGGWSVVSGDEQMIRICELSKQGILPRIEKVIMCMSAGGLYHPSDRSHDHIIKQMNVDDVHSWLENSKDRKKFDETAHDVSGGISGKVITAHRISSMGIDVWLIGGKQVSRDLKSILRGEDAGTHFRPFEGEIRCTEGIRGK